MRCERSRAVPGRRPVATLRSSPAAALPRAGLAWLLAGMWLSLALPPALASGEFALVDVAPLTVPCEREPTATRLRAAAEPGTATQAPTAAAGQDDCLLVRPLGEHDWTLRADRWDDFVPLDGHGYRLFVRGGGSVGGNGSGSAGTTGFDGDAGWQVLGVLEEVPLGDVRWRIEAVEVAGGRQDLHEAEAWLRVDASSGRLAGSAGCNGFFGEAYLQATGRIDLRVTVSTLIACEEPRMEQERLVLEALRGADGYASVGGRLRLAGGTSALWLSPLLPARPTAAGRVWGDGELACFDHGTADAAASGASWPHDPLLVTLALWSPWDAARVDLQRRDSEPEQAPYSVVSMEASGFLDDSLAGLRRVTLLERLADDRWRVVAATEAVRCARGEALWIGPPERCP